MISRRLTPGRTRLVVHRHHVPVVVRQIIELLSYGIASAAILSVAVFRVRKPLRHFRLIGSVAEKSKTNGTVVIPVSSTRAGRSHRVRAVDRMHTRSHYSTYQMRIHRSVFVGPLHTLLFMERGHLFWLIDLNTECGLHFQKKKKKIGRLIYFDVYYYFYFFVFVTAILTFLIRVPELYAGILLI